MLTLNILLGNSNGIAHELKNAIEGKAPTYINDFLKNSKKANGND